MNNKRFYKHNLLKKTITIFIVIIMVFYYAPNIVIAMQQSKETVDREYDGYSGDITDIKDSETDTEDTKILGEIVEKRGVAEKHFRLSNGNSVVAVYPNNIHYNKNGKIVDIDNTLEERNDKQETFKKAEMKVEAEIKAEAEVKTEVEARIGEIEKKPEKNPINTEATDTLIIKEEVIEKLEMGKDTKVYENKSNSFKVNFTNKTKGYNLGSITSKKHTLTWGLKDSKSSETNVINPNRNTDIVNAKSVDEIEINQAVSGIEYKNILSNIDINYTVGSEYIKEDIILNRKEAINNEIVFEYDTKGLKMKITDTKDIIVYNEKEKNIIFTIEAPFMYDNKLEFSSDIEMGLTEENGKYMLTLIPNKKWLEDEKRSYPITIDPKTYTDLYAESIDDTYIYSGDTKNTTKGKAHILRAGVGWKNPIRSLVKFTLPTLSSGDQIVNASMKLCNYPDTNEWAPSPHERVIDVHKVTANWAENTANWSNSATKFDSKVTDYILYKYDTASTKKANYFNITPVVKDWYTTGNNYRCNAKRTH